jgi:hypothetical protein
MSALRITKCAHIFCWPCLLQYIKHQQDFNLSCTCPLCNLPVLKHHLRSVKVDFVQDFKRMTKKGKEESKGQLDRISFDLMVRSKASTVVKVKKLDTNGLLPAATLPFETQTEFQRSRVMVSTLRGERLSRDLQMLEQGLKEAESSGEVELVPFYLEAIQYCSLQL